MSRCTPLPPNEHPRLLVRSKDIERITDNMHAPEARLAHSLWEKLCERDFPYSDGDVIHYNMHDYLAVEALALRSLLKNDKADAQTAIKRLLLLLDNCNYDDAQNMKARYGGHLIFVSAEVYDWCYHSLTDRQKEHIIERCEYMATQYFEIGYPPVKQGPISGHGCETQLLRDLLAFQLPSVTSAPIYTKPAPEGYSTLLCLPLTACSPAASSRRARHTVRTDTPAFYGRR